MCRFFRCCYGDSNSSGVFNGSPQSHEDPPLGLKEELIKKACFLAFKAHKSPKKDYVLDKKNRKSLEADLIISFRGCWDANDWYVGRSYGATNINRSLFPSLKSLRNDEVALVNEAFQLRFESILSNSSLKDEVNEAMAKGKRIVFTGHSSGAAVAILATLWTLEEYPNQNRNQIHKPPFCVTFGSPLVGNHILSHATRRENWSRRFVNFVTIFDIVPRILLAPFSSIEPNFSSILQFFAPKTKHSTHDSVRDGPASEFYSTVMSKAATVTSYAVSNLMDSTNLLLETMSGLVDLSPYRPFGTFIFCAGNGQLIVIRNPDAVLQLLFHIAQPSDLSEVSDVANKSIQQHLNYGAELPKSLEKLNVVRLDQLEGVPLSADGSNSDINTALDALGLDTRARLCLHAAVEWQKQKYTNEKKINEEFEQDKKAVKGMKDLQEYKATCEIGYYDAFKVHKDERDFKANVKRLDLAGVWDVIIEKLRSYELPDEFEANPKWIKRGTMYRRLVEPLDVANYYRHLKNKDAGPYMKEGIRPKRYRYTQRWSEHADRRRPEGYTESCFWAEVEELCNIASNNNGSFENVKERVVRLEAQIETWIKEGVLDKKVLLEGSTLVKWWKALPQQHRNESCIRSLSGV